MARWLKLMLGTIVLLFSGVAMQAAEIKVAVTTSFQNSGLSDVLLPQIKADLGLDVQQIVVGTGQALRLGEAGDVDAILVHSCKVEDAFIAAGFGTYRRKIMYNNFVLVGPTDDPTQIGRVETAAAALQLIADVKAPFVSSGDDSGTHKKELSLWQDAGLGAALNTASGMDAYIMADRASWLNFDNKGGLVLLYSGDPALFNQYAFIPVNPARHPHVKTDLAKALEDWLTSDTAAGLINTYKINGEVMLTFNARAQ